MFEGQRKKNKKINKIKISLPELYVHAKRPACNQIEEWKFNWFFVRLLSKIFQFKRFSGFHIFSGFQIYGRQFENVKKKMIMTILSSLEI